jgi:hypothetical protein
MSSNEDNASVDLRVTVRKSGVLEIYSSVGRTGEEFAAILRGIADKFEAGEVNRVE